MAKVLTGPTRAELAARVKELRIVIDGTEKILERLMKDLNEALAMIQDCDDQDISAGGEPPSIDWR